MRLLKFIERESDESYHQLALMAIISGVSNGLLIAVINHSTEAIINDEDLTQYFLIYMVSFILFLYTQWFAFDRAILLIEEAVYNVRIRLSRKIKSVELSFIENTSSDALYARLTQNDTFISQAVPQVTAAAQMFILMVFSFLYLAYLSLLTFTIFICTIALGVFIFNTQTKTIKEYLQQAKSKESHYFKAISDMINGFKEIKLNEKKAKDIIENISDVSLQAKNSKIQAGRREARMWGFGRVFIYALLPVLIFIIPSFNDQHADDIFKITSILLFIIGPITILVNMIPILNRVNMVIGEMSKLEEEMDQAAASVYETGHHEFNDFWQIDFNDVQFSYPGSGETFHSGPFNEVIKKGELLFIVGGNGSGKSTFLKLLTGLYYPESGQICVHMDKDAPSVSDPDKNRAGSPEEQIFHHERLLDRVLRLVKGNRKSSSSEHEDDIDGKDGLTDSKSDSELNKGENESIESHENSIIPDNQRTFVVESDNYTAYRNLFSVVFTDFHLFEKLYGLTVDADEVNSWLEIMRMQHKVSYKDGAFSSTNLSTGQRKRLAFIAAMLEDKHILVIDEFAADQDPQFRQYFYETLLPKIKKSGKTVIAVTHDDHYFHVADRVLKMEEGKLFEYSSGV